MHREQACTSIFPTWRIKKILQATGRLLAESHLSFHVISKTRNLSLGVGLCVSILSRADPAEAGPYE